MKKCIFLILSSFLSCSNFVYSQHPCLLAHYKLDGNAKNSVGINKDGVNYGATATTDRFGNANAALHFDGYSSRIEIPIDSFKLKEYSYSIWIKTDPFPLSGEFNKTILSIGGYGGDQALHLGYKNGGFRDGYNFNPYGASNAGNIPYERANPRFNVWEHVTVTVDFNFVKIYVNCKVVDSLPMKYYPFYGSGSPKFTIGCRFYDVWHFPGDLDDVKIYKCALTRNEIISEFCNNQPANITAWKDTIACNSISKPYYLQSTPGFSTYKWYDSAKPNTILGTTNSIYVTPTSTTTYIVENNKGQKSKVRLQIIKNPLKKLGSDTTLCIGQTLVLENTNSLGLWENGSTVASRTVQVSGVYSIKYTQGNCKFSDSIVVQFKPGKIFKIIGDTLLCNSETTSLLPNVDTIGFGFYWSDGLKYAKRSINNGGNYILNLKDSFCTSSSSINVTKMASPTVTFNLPNKICVGDMILLEATNKNASYMWNTGSSDSAIIVKKDGDYNVIATNLCGSDTESVQLLFKICNCLIHVPNSFTPDGNNRNERLEIFSDCDIIDFEFKIFNRWGQLVFKSREISNLWDGKYLNALVQEGLYVFVLNGKVYKNGILERIAQKGTVYLIR